MPHDPALVAETKEWLTKVAGDLDMAEFVLACASRFLEDVVFHSQQAAEKALKAYLTWNRQPFRKTHNLVELGESCAKLDRTLSHYCAARRR